MGLDNYVSKYSKRIYIDDDIINLFKDKNFRISSSITSFRGKIYDTVINTICDVSLYSTLNPYTLKEIEEKLTKFIDNININDVEKIDENEFNSIYDEDDEIIDVRKYFEDYNDEYSDDEYKITFERLCDLRDFFKICADNNLYIHADY
jgi:hypothetical protein